MCMWREDRRLRNHLFVRFEVAASLIGVLPVRASVETSQMFQSPIMRGRVGEQLGGGSAGADGRDARVAAVRRRAAAALDKLLAPKRPRHG